MVQSRGLLRIRQATILAALVVAIIIIVAAGIVSSMLRRETIEHAGRDLTTVSQITAERTYQTLSAADILIRSIQDFAAKQSQGEGRPIKEWTSTAAYHDALVRWQKLLPQVDAAAVVDAQGNMLANSRVFPAPKINIANVAFFRQLAERPDKGVVIANPMFSPLSSQWMLFLARSLTDDHGAFAGAVIVGVPVAYFESYFSTIDVGPDTSVALFNQDLRLIARWPRQNDSIGNPIPGGPPGLDMPQPGETALRVLDGVDGKMRRVAVTPVRLNDTTLYVSIGQTEGAILLPWRNASLWIAVFSVVGLAILFILTTLVIRALRQEDVWRTALVERETRLLNQTGELAAARDQAESANRARGEFLANMSHELRTPLNAVLGFSEILERELFGPLGDPRYKEFVLDIHSSGQHLLDIISNILDLTKIDAGKLELDERDVDIVDLMQLCLRLVSDTAKNGLVNLRFNQPPCETVLRGDPTRLKQILLNLLSNAVKFTPQGNDVTLSAGVTAHGYVMTVADTGIGMSPADIEEAMKPFRQIDSSLARRYQGTGLGLPLTKSLVELHGGTLEIQSEVAAGTVAIVTLPASRVTVESAPRLDVFEAARLQCDKRSTGAIGSIQ